MKAAGIHSLIPCIAISVHQETVQKNNILKILLLVEVLSDATYFDV